MVAPRPWSHPTHAWLHPTHHPLSTAQTAQAGCPVWKEAAHGEPHAPLHNLPGRSSMKNAAGAAEADRAQLAA
eukprot:SAG31_NODE_17865_length_655_cov_1.169065_2_plen_72_part_01